MPAVLNAANEISVNSFLNKRIGFLSIPRIVEKVMRRHKNITSPSLADIISADSWARVEAADLCG
jgi:1-deoxy-D-xylulose-5-phosphate reductoisomerase